MTGEARHYFAGGNTAKGFFSLFDSVFQGLDRLFILKGGPGTGKSSLIKQIADTMLVRGYDVDFIHCASDSNSLDGMIVGALKLGIVDSTTPHAIEAKTPGAVEQYVNLGQAWNTGKLSARKADIQNINRQISEAFQEAYSGFAEALRIHDNWEKYYIANMDFTKAEHLMKELIQSFYGHRNKNGQSDQYDRFLGAATPCGPVDYIQNLTANIEKRYFLKGRPGSGKSTVLKKLASAGKERGFDIELYHCGFDPNSLDMLILPQLSIAIFDSTAPHEYFPDRESDEIVDMYDRAIAPGTDEKYAADIAKIKESYSAKMKESTACLARAKVLHDQLKAIYKDAMNFSVVDGLKQEVQAEINAIANAYSNIKG